jgi:hypothetical protein
MGAWHKLIFSYQLKVFCFETGSHYVAQASLKLLSSGDPPASVSQVAYILYQLGCSFLLFWRLRAAGF